MSYPKKEVVFNRMSASVDYNKGVRSTLTESMVKETNERKETSYESKSKWLGFVKNVDGKTTTTQNVKYTYEKKIVEERLYQANRPYRPAIQGQYFNALTAPNALAIQPAYAPGQQALVPYAPASQALAPFSPAYQAVSLNNIRGVRRTKTVRMITETTNTTESSHKANSTWFGLVKNVNDTKTTNRKEVKTYESDSEEEEVPVPYRSYMPIAYTPNPHSCPCSLCTGWTRSIG